jgi:transcription elongation GreA/GreB family factor
LDKRTVIQMVVAQIEKDLAALISATKATHGEATDEQNKAENKYDTRALEASYLAQGQSRQVMELLRAKQEFAALSAADWPAKAAIDVGALVTLREGKSDTVYLVGPKAGGSEVFHEGTLVTVITPQSPLGQRLMGKLEGEFVVFPNDPGQRQRRIVRVV